MAHLGIVCPNVPGHINPTVALADAVRSRGHRVTFFLLGDPPAAVTGAGFGVVPVGGSAYPPDEFRAAVEKLGTLTGRPALKQTLTIGIRSAGAVLEAAPAAVRDAGVDAMLIDQASTPAGTVADQLGLPFATVCNALLLHGEPAVPPFFTGWRPRDAWWARLRNRLLWAAFRRASSPILKIIRGHRRRLGLPIPRRTADAWSGRLQLSQQPAAFEFPRRGLPKCVEFVGPLRLPGGYPPVEFPWGRLDGRPLIYASLGTLQNRVAGTFRLMAEACAGLDAQLVISTGRGVTPESLGDLPGGPVVVSYAPQWELLGRADLAITHAGLNTVLDALSKGVPMVAVPVTNEQPGIAARVAWVGAGEAVAGKRLTAPALRDAVIRVRSGPSYRAAAGQVRESIQTGGGAPRAAELIEQRLGLGA